MSPLAVLSKPCQYKWIAFEYHRKIKLNYRCVLSIGYARATMIVSLCTRGSHPEDITKCVSDGMSDDIRLLNCEYEEGDGRIMYHINHAVTAASTDTDIFICLIYHFTRWNFLNLQEIWMLCGQDSTKMAVPIHEIATILSNTVTDILLQVHAQWAKTSFPWTFGHILVQKYDMIVVEGSLEAYC